MVLIGRRRASDDEEAPSKKRSRNKEAQKAQAFKMELKHLLSQPLVAKGVMKKYITSGARSVVADLLENSDGKLSLMWNGSAVSSDTFFPQGGTAC